MDKNFDPNYIKCPDCKNILDLSFTNKVCPNPLCGFDFAGLNVYLKKNDDELRKILLKVYKARESREYKLVITAIKYSMGNYLAHFIECTWGAHYNTLYKNFIITYLDDLNILKKVLKSNVIKESENVIISKNGYKMFWELYCRLKKIHHADFRNFFISEFPKFHRKHYNEWFLKYEKKKRERSKKFVQKDKLF